MSSMQAGHVRDTGSTYLDSALCRAVATGMARGMTCPRFRRPCRYENRSAGGSCPAILFQGGLGIERVDVRRPAVHEQEDHSLGSRGKLDDLGARGSSERASSLPGVPRPGRVPGEADSCTEKDLGPVPAH